MARPVRLKYWLNGLRDVDTESLARAEGKTLSAVIQDALRQARTDRRLQEFAICRDTRAAAHAITGRAEAIIIGDHVLLELREYRGVRIIVQWTDVGSCGAAIECMLRFRARRAQACVAVALVGTANGPWDSPIGPRLTVG